MYLILYFLFISKIYFETENTFANFIVPSIQNTNLTPKNKTNFFSPKINILQTILKTKVTEQSVNPRKTRGVTMWPNCHLHLKIF